MAEKFLARHTTASLHKLLGEKRAVVALVPIGSTEPHGPHLGLGTDVVISAAACVRATEMLEKKGPLVGVIAPAVSYGVTECATGFPGAVSVPAAVLTAYVAAVCDGLLAQGVRHVCLVNNHLEPAHDGAIRAVLEGREKKVSVACPLAKKWARTLSAEFKSGACHAGQYETSIMMAAAPEMVDEPMRTILAPVPISLSDKLRAGVTTFAAMGMELAYAGDPAAATIEEGEQLIQRLADMVVGEIREAFGLPTG
ncbi:MAG: creatininase family protein [Deltaproteobacteria bacterium]|nr:creatininase family protein [Deltaproteobacteria bacterium]MCW5803507.1 creatininase family protein [Deltaproteobacteria bacterium]